ncbi:transcriptional regulator, TetR family [Aliiroseovarius halocynthiae]|nr:TetR family transcriptional regulator [Aliiroseovarius halocynthiae]SMR70782.1 transcriptional regulator, TetR family [Aliiroseovarius halocynthiae]
MSGPYHHGNLRNALIERAIEVMDKEGLEKLSLRGLARDLNVSHAAPLRHFANKADLLREIAQAGVERLIEASKSAGDLKPGLDRLRQTMNGYVLWATENAAYHHILRNPDVMRHASDDLKSSVDKFASMQWEDITAAQLSGWRPDEDPRLLYLHLISLTAGTAIVLTDPMYRAVLGRELDVVDIKGSIGIFLDAA